MDVFWRNERNIVSNICWLGIIDPSDDDEKVSVFSKLAEKPKIILISEYFVTFGRNFRLRTQLSFRFPVISAKYQVEGAEAIRTSNFMKDLEFSEF